MSSKIEIIIALKNATKAGLDSVKKGLTGIQGAANNVSDSLFNLKSGLATIGVGAGLNQVISTFASFDDQMRSVGAIAGATGDQLALMTAKAEALGSETRYSATQAAEGMQFLSMAGFDVGQSMEAIDGVLELAAANMMDLGQASDIATNVLSGMSLPIEDLGRVNDVLTKTAFSATTSVIELGEAMKIAGPAADGSNMSLEKVVSVLGGLGNKGIRGAEAGNAVKRMLMALQSPTARAKKQLSDLGIELTDQEGKFRGLIPILKDMGKSQIDLAQSTEIFGKFTATSALAAAKSSISIENLEQTLKSAAGTAKKAATEMEAGLGGSIRALKSAWEGLQIAFGKGLESGAISFVQFLTAEFRNLTETIKALNTDGSLNKWRDLFVTALKETYNQIVSFSKILLELLDIFSPVIKQLIEITPYVVAFGAAAFTTSKSIELMNGAISLTTAAMDMLRKVFYADILGTSIARIQRLTMEFGILRTAAMGMQAVMSTVWGFFLVPAAIGVALGTLIANFDKVADAAVISFNAVRNVLSGTSKKNQAELENLIAITDKVINKYAEFKNVKLPADIASESIQSLKTLNDELNRSKTYWSSYITQLEATNDGSREMAILIEDAKEKLNAVKSALISVQQEMQAYGESYQSAIDQASKVHENHLKLINDLTEKQITEEMAARRKALSDAEKAYRDSGKTETAELEKLQAEKQKIISESENKIIGFRKAAAENIQSTAADEIAIAESIRDEKLRILQDQLEREVVNQGQFSQQKNEIIKQYEAEKVKISETTEKAAAKAIESIQKESVKNYLKSVESRNKQEKLIYESKIKEIEKLESKGAISYKKANELKEKETIDFYKKIADRARVNFADAAKVYDTDSTKYIDSLENKLKAEQNLSDKIVEVNRNKQQQIKALEDAELGLRKAQMDAELAKTEQWLEAGVISAETAAYRKIDAEKEFYTFKLDMAKKAVSELAEAGKQETADYKNAVAEKIAAEQELETVRISAYKNVSQNLKEVGTEAKKTLDTVDGKESTLKVNTQQAKEGIHESKSLFEQFTVAAGSPVQVPTIDINADSGAGPVPFHEGIQQITEDFEAMKTKVADAEIRGVVGFDVDSQTLDDGLGYVQSAFDTLMTDLSGRSTQYGADFASIMQDGGAAAMTMAQDVISHGEEMISALTQSISDFGNQIAAIEAEILGVGANTEEQIRTLQQGLMSDYEVWMADRARVDELYAEGKAALEQGNYEKSKELMLAAQDLAKGLAQEVTDANGEVVVSLEEATTQAIALVEQAGAGATTALEGQRDALSGQQDAARKELQNTEAVVSSMQNAIDQFSSMFKQVFEQMGFEISDTMGEIKATVEEPMSPNVDVNPAKLALQELAQEAATQAATLEKEKIKMWESFQEADARFQGLILQNYETLADQAKTATEKYKGYMDELKKPVDTYVNFYGTASPTLPLTETINNVNSLMSDFKSNATAQIDSNVNLTADSGSGKMSFSGAITAAREGVTGFYDSLRTGAVLNIDTSSAHQALNGIAAKAAGVMASVDVVQTQKAVTPKPITAKDFFGDVKDLGKTDLQYNGKAYPVTGDKDVISQLQTALRRGTKMSVS